jgi:hypothetical protein
MVGVEHLPSKLEALSSNHSTAKKRKRRKESQEIWSLSSEHYRQSIRISFHSHKHSMSGNCSLFQLFYSKFTEYLEDFHIWLSVYSRPSSSGYLHTPRLAVSFFLLCVYACLTALVTSGGHEQVGGRGFLHSTVQIQYLQCGSLLMK